MPHRLIGHDPASRGNRLAHPFRPAQPVQIVEIGDPSWAVLTEYRHRKRHPDSSSGGTSLEEARIAGGLSVIVRTEDQMRAGMLLPDRFGYRHEIARAERNDRSIARSGVNAGGGGVSLGNAHRLRHRPDDEIAPDDPPALEKAFAATRADELQAAYPARRVAQRHDQGSPVDSQAVGSDGLVNQIRVIGRCSLRGVPDSASQHGRVLVPFR